MLNLNIAIIFIIEVMGDNYECRSIKRFFTKHLKKANAF